MLLVVTHEEDRVCRDIRNTFYAGEESGKARVVYEWDAVAGLTKYTKLATGEVGKTVMDKKFAEIGQLIGWLEGFAKNGETGAIVVLKDFHPYLPNPKVIRTFRNLITVFKSAAVTLLFVTPVSTIPVELEKSVQTVDYALPDPAMLGDRFDYVFRCFDSPGKHVPPKIRDQSIEASKGLTYPEAEDAFTLALIENKGFNEGFVKSVFSEKVQQVKKNALLQYIEPDTTFDQVGGLAGVKNWIQTRTKAFEPEARDYGLPYPKGILACGPPGVGKTLLAKATSHALNLPLFQLDIGGLFGSLVGQSEQNMRAVIKTLDGIGSSILFIDEIEKSLSVSATSGRNDGGTSSRLFSTLLSWLSDRKTPIFVIGTSNNFTLLPPELVRKGRFDLCVWLDLPNDKDRKSIWEVQLRNKKRNPDKFDIPKLVKATDKYTGAEIEQIIISAMFKCYAQNGKDITTKALLEECKEMIPQSTSNAEELKVMKDNAKGKLQMFIEDEIVGVSDESLRQFEGFEKIV